MNDKQVEEDRFKEPYPDSFRSDVEVVKVEYHEKVSHVVKRDISDENEEVNENPFET